MSLPVSRLRAVGVPALAGVGALAAVLALSGCVPNAKADAEAIGVTVTDTACAVELDTAPSGAITFQATNSGSDVNEFEILAADKLRIAGEKENIGPGTTVNYVLQLEPGTYYTACKKGMTGQPIGVAEFTVTKGAKVATASQPAAVKRAVANYTAYVDDQAGRLLVATQSFAEAYSSGDLDAARGEYASARAYYERIEPTAEQFGDIDPELDLREADLSSGGTWTGWHRIEKDLWPPAGTVALTSDARTRLADKLVADTTKLQTLVSATSFTLTLSQISNGATGLMEEVATSKITGEEETFSHTDLDDFQANVEGAKVAYGTVRGILAGKGADGKALVAELDGRFASLEKSLDAYRSGSGFVSYTALTQDQVKSLSDQVNAVSEPLSRVTSMLVQ